MFNIVELDESKSSQDVVSTVIVENALMQTAEESCQKACKDRANWLGMATEVLCGAEAEGFALPERHEPRETIIW